MPILVQVTAKQAQIPEEDATKARDPDSGNHDLEKVAPKACDPNSGNEILQSQFRLLSASRTRGSASPHRRPSICHSLNREENCLNREAPFSFVAGLRSFDHLSHFRF
ncbi:hypothetical protein TIFTF001_036167 [Ficus carica]|uniref:Uncharacterized protein n=1 Tax=Ficus carica TaxID=3494 RepID=A0AA88JAX5_FICCA|nr:hypothetical protein TIFTF001_036167 [Ficus carica]